jgi:hypothetical protein
VGADEAGDGFVVAEDGDGGDALDTVLGGVRLFGVDVDLGNLELAVTRQQLDRRFHHQPRRSPGHRRR